MLSCWIWQLRHSDNAPKVQGATLAVFSSNQLHFRSTVHAKNAIFFQVVGRWSSLDQ